jgi:hypothetical protein
MLLDDDDDDEFHEKIQIPRHKILATDMDSNLQIKVLECKKIK